MLTANSLPFQSFLPFRRAETACVKNLTRSFGTSDEAGKVKVHKPFFLTHLLFLA